MSEHAYLPPSGAKAWRRCSLWPKMNATYPKGDTQDSLEGTAAHWVWAEMLQDRTPLLGSSAPNGCIITEEMLEGAELFCDVVNERIHADGGFGKVHIEERTEAGPIHDQCWGTPDVWFHSETKATLELLEYKFGHRFVDEFENEQNVIYAENLLQKLTKTPIGFVDQLITVNITIVQPRCFYKGEPVRTWSVKASELRGLVNILRNSAEAAMKAETATVNDECRDCHGRHACSTYQLAAYDAVELSTKSLPLELSPEAASLELRIIKTAISRLEGRASGLEETVIANIRAGKSAPFHAVEQGYGREKWNLPDEEVIAMGKLFEKDLTKVGTITPKQAVKLGIDESVIKAYSIIPLGKLKLIDVNPNDVRRIFK